MAKGVAIKFNSYNSTVPKLLEVIKFDQELKKHSKIVLKPSLKDLNSLNTPVEFAEAVLQFCLKHKNPGTEIFIAEGSDGEETIDVFEKKGYRNLAEKYAIGLIDLNNTEVEEIVDGDFLKFQKIIYPKLLLDSFIISLPKLSENEETEIQSSLSNMLGAFPSSEYTGFFSSKKNKIRKWPIKYSIHDILKCKMPEFTVIDASDQGYILAGQPIEMDRQAAKLLGKEWKSVSHLRLISESFSELPQQKSEEKTENKIKAK